MPEHHMNIPHPLRTPPSVFGGDSGGAAGPPSRAPFQVLVRLQHLRAQVKNWISCDTRDKAAGYLKDVIWELSGLAVAAVDFGSGAYAFMCLECARRLERIYQADAMAGSMGKPIEAWLDSSDYYLRQPTRAAAVADLVVRFAELSSEEELFDTAAQSSLFRALLFPG